ncbi:DUF2334 domain-containing protein [Oscillospiraceae bacterium LTW-04]|nr:DUF2334 domain-containing protein [Oscillospiraceae bacterium MB24-C1]
MKCFFRFATFLMAVLLLLTLGVLADSEQAAEPQTAQVLLVCDEKKGRAAIEALISACGKTVDSVSETTYTADLPARYSYVITTANQPYLDAAAAGIPTVCLGESAGPVDGVTTLRLKNMGVTLQLDDHSQYQFIKAATVAQQLEHGQRYGSIELSSGDSFPFAVILSNAVYVPWYQQEGLSYIMLGGLLRQYFGADSADGAMYVLLDEIYPFSDLDMLYETTDRFAQSGIPFIVRVMPVYDNLDYPAFKRYTRSLRYVQAKGGAIVLHDPIVRQYESEREPLADKLTRAKAAFAEEGITLFDMNFPGLAVSFEDIQGIAHTRLNFGNLPIDTMIRFSLFKDVTALKNTVQQLDDAWLSISDYKSKFPELESLHYEEKTIDASYVYRESMMATLSGFFSGANRILLIIVSISVAVFLVLIAVGRRIYRQMFYRR